MPRNRIIIHSEPLPRVFETCIYAMHFHCSNVFRAAKLKLFFVPSKFFLRNLFH
jgi:hypothetical protein